MLPSPWVEIGGVGLDLDFRLAWLEAESKVAPEGEKEDDRSWECEAHPLNEGDWSWSAIVDVLDCQDVLWGGDGGRHTACIARPGKTKEESADVWIIGIEAADDWEGEGKNESSRSDVGEESSNAEVESHDGN